MYLPYMLQAHVLAAHCQEVSETYMLKSLSCSLFACVFFSIQQLHLPLGVPKYCPLMSPFTVLLFNYIHLNFNYIK